MNLDYLMTSDFNEGFKAEEFIELLLRFRYEYRLLSGKNKSLEQELDKLLLQVENLNGLLYENDTKYLSKIAILEDKLHFTTNRLNSKLTLKERLNGKINRE
jgi:hypothetical protein